MVDQKKLIKLNKEIKNCKKCPLWKTRKNTVPGEGPANAKIMVVGQAPGDNEDKTGRPFIGRAGKFLNQLLEISGVQREKVFITSPIKCFPPKNRKPGKEEITSCLPYFKKQIEIINPQKLILLGEVAFKIFFSDKKLKDSRGKWVERDNKRFFVTYHPAAGIRFFKMRKILEKDFKNFKKKT